MDSDPALSFENVSKVFDLGSGTDHTALSDVTLRIGAGERVAVVGRSGSGKSTLLHLAAGIDMPTSGTVSLFGRRLDELDDERRTLLRREKIGLVFQFFHLLPHLSVLENTMLPAWIGGDRSEATRTRGTELIERVGLGDRAAQLAEKLSGGEMQRVALCRALLLRPRLVLADEPTGNLDDESGARVIQLLLELVEAEGTTLVFVTHSAELAAQAGCTYRLHSGILERA